MSQKFQDCNGWSPLCQDSSGSEEQGLWTTFNICASHKQLEHTVNEIPMTKTPQKLLDVVPDAVAFAGRAKTANSK